MKALNAYFLRKVDAVYESFVSKFDQKVGETIEQFHTELTEPGKVCRFVDLEDQKLDQIIIMKMFVKAFGATEYRVTKIERRVSEMVRAITHAGKRRRDKEIKSIKSNGQIAEVKKTAENYINTLTATCVCNRISVRQLVLL